ncbi:MAG: serine protease [Polyangiaceae bacterium]|nr:serine protease [Polyangiaceae bacterium]
MSPPRSTDGYSDGVNSRQQRRWGLGLVAAIAVVFATGSVLADDGPPAPKKPNPVAAAHKLKAALKEASDEILPVADESPQVKGNKGLVVLQRAGQVVGLGTVLDGDGRILTALSPLGNGNDLEAKFADDTVRKVKVGHQDRAWDLALLVPQSGKWTEGLKSSNANPLKDGSNVRAFSVVNKAKPVANDLVLRSKRTLIGGDDEELDNALEIGSKVNSKDIGSPIVDESGRVVGVLSRACLPIEGKPCAPVAYGVPMPAIKSFLKGVPADAVQPAAWLGIQGAPESTSVVKGVRVLSVAKNSPASEAKLKGGDKGAGDMIVAVGGDPVTNNEELAAAVKKRAIGEKVPLTLFSKGAYKTVDVVLRAPPEVAKPAAKAPAASEEREFATPPEGKKSSKKSLSKAARSERVEAFDAEDAEEKPVEKKPAAKKKTKFSISIDKDPFNDPD